MVRNEKTSKRVASIAAKILRSPCLGDVTVAWVPAKKLGGVARAIYWREIRALAASCLTQSPDKPKRKRK